MGSVNLFLLYVKLCCISTHFARTCAFSESFYQARNIVFSIHPLCGVDGRSAQQFANKVNPSLTSEIGHLCRRQLCYWWRFTHKLESTPSLISMSSIRISRINQDQIKDMWNLYGVSSMIYNYLLYSIRADAFIDYPRRQEALDHCRVNVGPASQTLDQH